MKQLAAVILGLIALSSASAFAQTPASCEKIGTLTCQAKGVASAPLSLTGLKGDVSVLRNAQLIDAQKESGARIGDRILVGKGSATIAMGPNCIVAIPQDATARIVSSQGQTCVDLGSNSVTELPQPSGDSGLVIMADTVLITKTISDIKNNKNTGLSP